MNLAAGISLAAATWLSEDAATLTAGALVAARVLPVSIAVAWIALGIWAGDLGLFAIGRLARRQPRLERWIDRRWSIERVRAVELRLQQSAAGAVLLSRFLPGTRVVLYVAAGLLNVRASTFAISAAIAAAAWAGVVISAVGALRVVW